MSIDSIVGWQGIKLAPNFKSNKWSDNSLNIKGIWSNTFFTRNFPPNYLCLNRWLSARGNLLHAATAPPKESPFTFNNLIFIKIWKNEKNEVQITSSISTGFDLGKITMKYNALLNVHLHSNVLNSDHCSHKQCKSQILS